MSHNDWNDDPFSGDPSDPDDLLDEELKRRLAPYTIHYDHHADLCIRCDDAPRAVGDLCVSCVYRLRADVEHGIRMFKLYLAAWAAFRAWEATEPTRRTSCPKGPTRS